MKSWQLWVVELLMGAIGTLFMVNPVWSQEEGLDRRDIVIIMDESGSMAWTDPQALRIDALQLIPKKARGRLFRACLLGFSEHYRVLSPKKPAEEPAEFISMENIAVHFDKIYIRLEDLGPYTNIREALGFAYDTLEARERKYPAAVILFTDGKQTADDLPEEERPLESYLEGLRELVRKFRTKGWPIYPVAFSDQADEEFLDKEIAEPTGGKVEGRVLVAKSPGEIALAYSKIFELQEIGVTEVTKGVILRTAPYEEKVNIAEGVEELVVEVFKREPSSAHPSIKFISPTGLRLEDKNELKNRICNVAKVLQPQSGDWTIRISGEEVDLVDIKRSHYTGLRLYVYEPEHGKIYDWLVPVKAVVKRVTEGASLEDLGVTVHLKKPSRRTDSVPLKPEGEGAFSGTVNLNEDGPHTAFFDVMRGKEALTAKAIEAVSFVGRAASHIGLVETYIVFDPLKKGGTATWEGTLVAENLRHELKFEVELPDSSLLSFTVEPDTIVLMPDKPTAKLKISAHAPESIPIEGILLDREKCSIEHVAGGPATLPKVPLSVKRIVGIPMVNLSVEQLSLFEGQETKVTATLDRKVVGKTSPLASLTLEYSTDKKGPGQSLGDIALTQTSETEATGFLKTTNAGWYRVSLDPKHPDYGVGQVTAVNVECKAATIELKPLRLVFEKFEKKVEGSVTIKASNLYCEKRVKFSPPETKNVSFEFTPPATELKPVDARAQSDVEIVLLSERKPPWPRGWRFNVPLTDVETEQKVGLPLTVQILGPVPALVIITIVVAGIIGAAFVALTLKPRARGTLLVLASTGTISEEYRLRRLQGFFTWFIGVGSRRDHIDIGQPMTLFRIWPHYGGQSKIVPKVKKTIAVDGEIIDKPTALQTGSKIEAKGQRFRFER